MAIVLGALMTLAALAAGWNAREAWITRRRRMRGKAAMERVCRAMTDPACVAEYDQMVAAYRELAQNEPEQIGATRSLANQFAANEGAPLPVRAVGVFAKLFMDGIAMERGMTAAEQEQA